MDREFVPQTDAAATDRVWTPSDALRVIGAHPDKATPPDTATDYTNSGYFLLGLVLEKVTGRPVRDVINDLVRDYGLRDTSFPADATMPDPHARGYGYDHDVRTDVTTRTPPTVWGAAGSLVSTVTDLAAYAPMLAEGRFLKSETLRARTTFTAGSAFGSPMDYGLGIMREGSWIGHDGGVLGYTAMTMYLPERKVSLAVVSNQYSPHYVSLLPLNSQSLWMGLAAKLYPGTIPGLDASATAPTPTLPAPGDLNDRLREALNPAIPPAAKRLRVEGDDKDPDLMTKVAHAYSTLAISVTVDNDNIIGTGMFATTSTTTPHGNLPMLVPFTAVDGAWRLSRGWACQQIAVVDEQSAACSSAQ
ncbi:serine hydrolase domain-containing protein [Nocardia terrae]|uniref:serine hydrolase domain-containing protein n=1 Tax=Nocardia terrae TaxID=2675851 RepID=UPI0012FBC851|nr:serine hydrolase domain-containing protein [Nocardia terrae]